MLRLKDVNRKSTHKKELKNKKKNKYLQSQNKENKKTKFSELINPSTQELVNIVLKKPQKAKTKTLFGVNDIKSIFIDKADFTFTKKQTLTNAEKTPYLRSKKETKKAKRVNNKSKNCKKQILSLSHFYKSKTTEFIVYKENERFSLKSKSFLKKRISQEFDNDIETDEDMARGEISIEKKIFLKAIKRHSF